MINGALPKSKQTQVRFDKLRQQRNELSEH